AEDDEPEQSEQAGDGPQEPCYAGGGRILPRGSKGYGRERQRQQSRPPIQRVMTGGQAPSRQCRRLDSFRHSRLPPLPPHSRLITCLTSISGARRKKGKHYTFTRSFLGSPFAIRAFLGSPFAIRGVFRIAVCGPGRF